MSQKLYVYRILTFNIYDCYKYSIVFIKINKTESLSLLIITKYTYSACVLGAHTHIICLVLKFA